jgi:hypothetical protein
VLNAEIEVHLCTQIGTVSAPTVDSVVVAIDELLLLRLVSLGIRTPLYRVSTQRLEGTYVPGTINIAGAGVATRSSKPHDSRSCDSNGDELHGVDAWI